MDLYTFGTPNGQKISIALEELGVDYRVHKIDITKGAQHEPEYLRINPNAKIPALVDGELKIFESVAILIYLAEAYGELLPKDDKERYETLSWCLFQAASVGPMLGQLGHFSVYAKEKIPYAIERYTIEVKRIFGVLNTQLGKFNYVAGHDYTIADIATWPWIHGYTSFYKLELDEKAFPNLARWYKEVGKRPAVQKGMLVPA